MNNFVANELKDMLDFTPHLHFPGTAGSAMTFYKSILGGEFRSRRQFKDIPGGEKMAAENQEKFIHIALVTPKGQTLMAMDAMEGMGEPLIAGNNFQICIQADNADEADHIFSRLSDRGKIEMPMNKTFWGDYFGMCEDKFGIRWMINFATPAQ